MKRPSSPLLHEYHRQTEHGDAAPDWAVMQARLFEAALPPALRAPRHRLLVGSLAAVASVWLLAAPPWHSEVEPSGASGAGGSDGATGRARGWGGARGTAGG